MRDGDLIGEKLGNFVILEKIGSGGMGSVYKAKQMGLDRIVAVKVLKPELGVQNSDFVKRFIREARTAALINHPNVVQVFTVGAVEGIHFLAMELILGESVGSRLDRTGSMPEKDAILVAIQAAKGLKAAFEKGLIHRDIKPDNLLVSLDGTVKVVDFGLARMVDVHSRVTREGVTIGTIAYMSPEQVKGEDLDFRSDLYSLGATLYHMISGKQPFEADNAVSVAFKHLNEPPAPPRKLNPGLSAGIEAVVLRMMAKPPEKRYQSFDTLIEDLESVLTQGHPSSTDTTAYIELAGAPPSGPASRKRTVLLAASAAAAAAAAVLAAVLVLAPGTRNGAVPAPVEGGPSRASVSITRPRDGAWLNSPRISVEGECSADVTQVTVNGNQAQISAGRFKASFWISGEGVKIAAEAFSAGGGKAKTEISVRIDTKPPEISITSPGPGGGRTREKAFLLEGLAKDENPSCILVDGARLPNAAGAFRVPVTLPDQGEKTVAVEAVDLAGNSTVRQVVLARDLKPPEVTLLDFPQGDHIESESNRLALRFRIDEEASRISVNGAAVEPAGLLYQRDIDLSEGVNSVVVEVVDLAGNPSVVKREISYKAPAGRSPHERGDFDKVLAAMDKAASTADKIRILDAYLGESPSASSRAQAEEMLAALRATSRSEEEQKAYDAAVAASGSAASPFARISEIRKFLAAFPKGKFAPKAAEIVELLRREGLPDGVTRSDREGEYVNEKDGAVMVLVPAGSFLMGSTREEVLSIIKNRPDLDFEMYESETPIHSAMLDSYFIYKHEVSNAQFAKFLNETGSVLDERKRPLIFEDAWGVQMHEDGFRPAAGFERHPVVQVTYYGAEKYAEWAGVRLPTEAQWERASSWDPKGGKNPFPWGGDFKFEICNTADFWFKKEISTQSEWIRYSRMDFDSALTKPVDSMPEGASPCGCLHMCGNVWEWCADWFSESFYKSPASREKNPVNSFNTHLKSIRGGCFNKAGMDCRAQRRGRFGQSEHGRILGFRCARGTG